MRFNDGRCDRRGRFLAGTMFLDMAAAKAVGVVSSFDANGNQRALVDQLIVPNGMAFSPDGRTMYLSDSHPTVTTVWAYDYDVATGTPANRRFSSPAARWPAAPMAPPWTLTAATGFAATTPGLFIATPRRQTRPLVRCPGEKTGHVRVWWENL